MRRQDKATRNGGTAPVELRPQGAGEEGGGVELSAGARKRKQSTGCSVERTSTRRSANAKPMPPRQPTAGARDPLGSIVPSGSKNSDAEAPGIMAAEERAAGVEPGIPSSTGSVAACATLASESPADSPGAEVAHTDNKELAESTPVSSSRQQPTVVPPAEPPEVDVKGRRMRKRAREPEERPTVPKAGAQVRVTDVSQHEVEGGKAESGPAASGDVAGPYPCRPTQLVLSVRLPLVR